MFFFIDPNDGPGLWSDGSDLSYSQWDYGHDAIGHGSGHGDCGSYTFNLWARDAYAWAFRECQADKPFFCKMQGAQGYKHY